MIDLFSKDLGPFRIQTQRGTGTHGPKRKYAGSARSKHSTKCGAFVTLVLISIVLWFSVSKLLLIAGG
jgi:hypothetical protein